MRSRGRVGARLPHVVCGAGVVAVEAVRVFLADGLGAPGWHPRRDGAVAALASGRHGASFLEQICMVELDCV